MTADEYLALGETPDRYELIDGVVMMSPSPTPLHQALLEEIVYQLGHARRSAGLDVSVFIDTDIRFTASLVYRPDLAVFGAGRTLAVPRRLESAPALIVEILSPASRPLDLITKRGDYERFGVAEYWVVDPDSGSFRCWQRRADRFEEIPVEGPALASSALPGFALDLTPLRRLIAGA